MSVIDDRVEQRIRIAAEPAAVFEFLIRAELITLWIGERAELDPRPGGSYRLQAPDAVAIGTYEIVDPPHRVVMTWGWEGNPGLPPGSTRVEITLKAVGDGTEVALVHSGLPDAEACGQHDGGWEHYLGRLAVAASGGAVGADPWVKSSADAEG